MSIFDLFRSDKREPAQYMELPPESPKPEPAPKKSSSEMLIESVRKFRAEFAAVEAAARQEHEAAIADATKRIGAANRLVNETGIDKSLCILLAEVWHWPSWAKQKGFDQDKNFEATNVRGEEERSNKAEIRRVFFDFADFPYCLIFTEDTGYFDGTKFGRIDLFAGDRKVISLSVCHDLNSNLEYNEWTRVQIDALEPGPWIAHVVEMEQKIKLNVQRQRDDMVRERLQAQSRNLPALD